MRRGFKEPQIKKRRLRDIAIQRRFDILEHGKKIRLSDETLDQLLSVTVPDPEKKGAFITKRINIGQTVTDVQNSLAAVETAINTGAADSIIGFQNVTNRLGDIVQKTDVLNRLNQDQLNVLVKSIRKIVVPSDTVDAGFVDPNFTLNEYMADKKSVNMYVLANYSKDLRIKQDETQNIISKLTDEMPIYVLETRQDGSIFEPVTWNTFGSIMSEKNHYLDLKYLTLVPYGVKINEDGNVIEDLNITPDFVAGIKEIIEPEGLAEEEEEGEEEVRKRIPIRHVDTPEEAGLAKEISRLMRTLNKGKLKDKIKRFARGDRTRMEFLREKHDKVTKLIKKRQGATLGRIGEKIRRLPEFEEEREEEGERVGERI